MYRKFIAAACLLGMLLTSNLAVACRCSEQTLQQYFDNSDLVFVATLSAAKLAKADGVGGSPDSGNQILQFGSIDRYYKAPNDILADNAVLPRFVTPTTAAQCGLTLHLGARYVVFTQLDSDSPMTATVTSCAGSRPVAGEFAQGFGDIPANRVTQQLDALAGAAILAKASEMNISADNPLNETMVGLLTLEGLDQGTPITTYQRPDNSEDIPADDPRIVHYSDELISREISAETPAAEVYARVDGWLKVHRQGLGFRWVQEAEAGPFWPYDTLPIRRLSYLNAAWDGYIWPDPGAGLPWYAKHGEGDEHAVVVHDSQRIGGSLWFKIELLSQSPCEGIDPPRSLAAGWVPAYGSSAKPAVWFYSRGC